MGACLRPARWACLALLLCGGVVAAEQTHEWPTDDDNSIEARVARLAIAQGAQLSGFKIGQECPTCLRGVIATRDLEEGHVIQVIPLSLSVRFRHEGPAIPALHARDLLDRLHNEPGFNQTWGLFWLSQPGPEGVFSSEVYTDAQLAALQTPDLEDIARWQRDQTVAVYAGETGGHPPFNETVPAVDLATFQYVSSLLCTRMFGIPRDGDEERLLAHLVPVADFFNHADEPNAWRNNNDTHMTVQLVEPVRAGQAITFNYFHNVIHRPDMSLFYFGFVEAKDPPLLASVDLPTYNYSDVYAETPPDDSIYDDPKSPHVTREEHERLAERLAACATTLEEDEALLTGGTLADWKERALVQYRVQRKRALRLAMSKIAAHLGLGDEAGHGGEL